MPLGREVGFSPSDIVLHGHLASPPPKGGEASPQFSADVYCGQTAGRMKMPLSTEVDLSQGHILLHGDAAPPAPAKGALQFLRFDPCLLWPWSPISATAELLLLNSDP